MFIIKLFIVCVKVAWSCAYCASSILIFGKLIYKRIFFKSVVGTYVPACDVLYRLGVFLPCAISQMKALLSPLAITSRLPFLVISAWHSLTVATKSPLFKVSSCFQLFQVQALPFFSKLMCHSPVFQKEGFF